MIFDHFRKCAIYTLSRDVTLCAEELEKQLAAFAFTPCGSQDMGKTGFTSPWGSLSDSLVMTSGHFMLLAIKSEKKILPAHVIKTTLTEKIERLQNEQGRKLKKTEKDSLKDEVLHSLLPRAFSKFSESHLLIDTKNKRIFTSCSGNGAENILALLRKALGSLPVVPLTLESPAELTLTEWVRKGGAPAGFKLLNNAELKALLEDGGIIRAKKQELVSDEITSHLDAGKLVTSLELDWQGRINFTVNDACYLSRLKFADELRDQNDDIDREDAVHRLNADFLLFTGELSALVGDLITALGGECER